LSAVSEGKEKPKKEWKIPEIRKQFSRQEVTTRASFCCSKKVRKLDLFSPNVAFMRSKKVGKFHLFSTKVAFMRKHCKR